MEQADVTKRIKDILQRVKDNKITPAEGRKNIEEIKTMAGAPTGETLPEAGGVAVIGMSGRFPGASNLEEYWSNLRNGINSVTEVPGERWNIEEYYDPEVEKLDKTNSRWGGFLSDIDKFDPAFFNISGMEAEVMDPQQRLFLEECWKSLEDAGYANDLASGLSCGVYVGAAPRDYLNNISEREIDITAQAFWGNTGSVLASRISYLLNLKGPAMAIDTACSSSLVALHLACQSIILGENTMAIAGGVWICSTPHYYIFTSNAGMLSPEGKCKSFDNAANGIVNGEGVGAVVLKSLAKAVKDGDYIYGVIRSSGINQDGKTNGITAPSSLSQTALELEVYKKGNINPETITYLETHGTGTKLGDPIEIEALKNAFQEYTAKKQFCALGSVKTNIGHSSLAAGIASFLKAVLALKHKEIPPSLNFQKENEHLELENSPFYVNTRLKDWSNEEGPLRAGVSSFGFGGTNAHLVIEEYQETRNTCKNRNTTLKEPCYLAAFSGKTTEELRQRLKEFLAWSKKNQGTYRMGDICYSLGNRRKHFHKRIAFVVKEQSDLEQAINHYLIKGESGSTELLNTGSIQLGNHSRLYEELGRNPSAEDFKEILQSFSAAYQNREELIWSRLYREEEHLKIPLPVYPFARNSYWVQANETKLVKPEIIRLHPLIDENISSFKEQKFRTEISLENLFRKDCLSHGRNHYPYANFLEILRKAGEISGEKPVRIISNIHFAGNDIFNGKEYLLNTKVYPVGEHCQGEIVAVNEEEEFVCAQAQLIFVDRTNMLLANRADTFKLDMDAPDLVEFDLLKNDCPLVVQKEELYTFLSGEFKRNYGADFQIITALSIATEKNSAFAEISMRDHVCFLLPDLELNTFFLESAFQIGLFLIQDRKLSHYYLSGFDSLEIFKRLPKTCFVHMVLSGCEADKEEEVWKFNVSFLNTEGEVAVRISNYNIIGY
ncbi:beta-ketoacyl synthase N-terminal-like domain-containing protein [Anaerocolumna sp. AGMB13020]|uniref:type I polyketide synthase n=1 Tax=Anaerocolumna sp. AGMB13020 TaxID=3081750 RepID=UPI002953DD70|nr:beta-ketoacyl synthase N-terminal-like domain-containing protein [Anaerocolumna sp. AGMB13020]WOO37930.1 beta-ketoacyl synthase N-terminal-like domain-containing protein [Anaerocolumna sp. AGMB13020]